ncbi:MAG: hypothetical protein UX98_C0003G0001 [Parcubacteria group bacterium GW2011_GWA2_47_26]|nr:MAG: hypothetical protein UX98_C0003G0001 [Parcubacteria group bacterium GW2011_GWA2_47_26]
MKHSQHIRRICFKCFTSSRSKFLPFATKAYLATVPLRESHAVIVVHSGQDTLEATTTSERRTRVEAVVHGPQVSPEEEERAARVKEELRERLVQREVHQAAKLEGKLTEVLYRMAVQKSGPEAGRKILERLELKRELRDAELQGEPRVFKHRRDADLRTEEPVWVSNEVAEISLKSKEGLHKAIWKSEEGEPLMIDKEGKIHGVYGMDPQTQYRHEWLAGFISEALSRGEEEPMVPATVIRLVDGRIGSAQDFVDGVIAATAQEAYGFSWMDADGKQLQLLSAMDYILENLDGKNNNFMITADGKVRAIDQALTLTPAPLHESEQLIRSFPLRLQRKQPIDQEVQARLKVLFEPQISALLKEVFNFALRWHSNELFDRFQKRVQELLEKREFPDYAFLIKDDEKIFNEGLGWAKTQQLISIRGE